MKPMSNKAFVSKQQFDNEQTRVNNELTTINNIKADKIEYSLEEVDTGNKWIDGKKIYRKVYTKSKCTKGTSSYIDLGFSLAETTIIKMHYIFSGSSYVLNSNFGSDSYIDLMKASNRINIHPSLEDVSLAIVILEYTKNE